MEARRRPVLLGNPLGELDQPVNKRNQFWIRSQVSGPLLAGLGEQLQALGGILSGHLHLLGDK